MHYRYCSIAIIAFTMLLSACGSETGTSAHLSPGAGEAASMRNIDLSRADRGGELYRKNCATCHGAEGEGAPNWRQRDARGFFPAPPLNGSGHAWHHPRRMLEHVIRNGSPGGGRMPAWEGRLSDDEITAIVDWFQLRWPDDVYAAWKEMEMRTRQTSR